MYRFIDLVDIVLCTEGERDPIAKIVLTIEKIYIAFIAKEAKMDKVHTEVDCSCNEAAGKGYFLFPDTVPTIVGTNALPIHVPTRNARPCTDTETIDLMGSDDMGSTPKHHRAVMAKTAAEFSFEIKVGTECDYSTSRDTACGALRLLYLFFSSAFHVHSSRATIAY